MKDKSFTRKFAPAAQSLQVAKKGMIVTAVMADKSEDSHTYLENKPSIRAEKDTITINYQDKEVIVSL
ncbi:MAG TPA: hypothetical protein DEG06_04425 [Lachnospiraceae bacterium]|nr:hypothetical protein [Lachnospiraceae bacterium]HCA69119.1 hypothetical protein [Lachnospiraceae bacterium]HCM13107.1 hypothetical protein [Lachnospiraceae bacterium]